MPEKGDPLRDIPAARSEPEIRKAWHGPVSYSSSLEAVGAYWETLLRRYKTLVDPDQAHILTSALHCSWPDLSPDLDRDLQL